MLAITSQYIRKRGAFCIFFIQISGSVTGRGCTKIQ
nr:MAG TPA: hypothetical protein [Caudoviricetes sp.]